MREMIRRFILGSFLMPLILVVFNSGCFFGQLGQYQVPEPIGKGKVRAGIAGGAAIRIDEELGFSGDVWGVTSDLWIDVGIGKKWDLRLGLSNVMFLDFRPGRDNPSFDILGLDVQFKRSNSSEDSAFIVGVQPQLVIDVVVDHTDVDMVAPVVYFGGVFGFGEPGNIRFLLTPTFSGGFGGVLFGENLIWFELAVSAGLEIPITDGLRLRPEFAIHLTPVVIGDDGGAVVTTTLGMAMVF